VAGEKEARDRPNTVEVAAGVKAFPAGGLFGGHVSRRTRTPAPDIQICARITPALRLHEAEVQQLGDIMTQKLRTIR